MLKTILKCLKSAKVSNISSILSLLISVILVYVVAQFANEFAKMKIKLEDVAVVSNQKQSSGNDKIGTENDINDIDIISDDITNDNPEIEKQILNKNDAPEIIHKKPASKPNNNISANKSDNTKIDSKTTAATSTNQINQQVANYKITLGFFKNDTYAITVCKKIAQNFTNLKLECSQTKASKGLTEIFIKCLKCSKSNSEEVSNFIFKNHNIKPKISKLS